MRTRVSLVGIVGLLWLGLGCGGDTTAQTAADAGSDSVVSPDLSVSDDTGGDDLGPPPFTCDDEDAFSPNHSGDGARLIDANGLEAEDLFLCPGFDDFYAVDLLPGGGILARIEFANRLGDFDLYLLPEGATDTEDAVAVSETQEDVEEIRFTAEEGGRFVIWVHGVDNAAGFYDLRVSPSCRTDDDCPCGLYASCDVQQMCVLRDRACADVFEPQCGDDSFEPNNTMSSPYALHQGGAGVIAVSGAVCGDDVEYFLVNLNGTVSVTVDLSFDPAGDLDLAWLGPDGEVIATSLNTGATPERLDLPVLAPGRYLLYIDTTAGVSTETTYALDMSITAADACIAEADCAGVPGRELCEGGGCVSFQADEPGELGAICDSDDDCSDAAPFCYTGNPGLGDNLCTNTCRQQADCSDLEGGSCLSFGFSGLCFPSCQSDTQCPAPYACDDAGACTFFACGVDSDCSQGRACLRTEDSDEGFCSVFVEPTCPGLEPDGDSRSSDATPIEPGQVIDDLTICNADDDWFSVAIDQGPALLEVSATFQGQADLDVFIYDAQGRPVGDGTSQSDNPETARAELLPAGSYLVRVNQFPAEGADRLTSYTLAVRLEVTPGCSTQGGECLALSPLRIDCVETGACQFLEGEGSVELGSLCDSDDDCVDGADFCFVFDGAQNGNNICTRSCTAEQGCDDVGDTVCTPLGRRFAACLPGGE